MAYYADRIAEEPCGCRVDIPTGLVTHYCDEHDPERIEKWLEAATARCVYRINGLCEIGCPARAFCLPEVQDLIDCDDIAKMVEQ